MYEPFLDPDSKKQNIKTIYGAIMEMWKLTGYLTILWNYSLVRVGRGDGYWYYVYD